MPEVSLVDGNRAFTVDPGKIAPAVLRAMWAGLHAAIPPELAARLDAAAGLVGLAGVWSALTQDRRYGASLASAVRAAVEGVAAEPERWRAIGSDLVLQALYIAGDSSPAPESTVQAAASPATAPASATVPADPTGAVHHRYQGKLVARATSAPNLPST